MEFEKLEVKIIGPSIGHVPHKPSRHDGDGDGFADLNGDGIDKEPVPDIVDKPLREAGGLLKPDNDGIFDLLPPRLQAQYLEELKQKRADKAAEVSESTKALIALRLDPVGEQDLTKVLRPKDVLTAMISMLAKDGKSLSDNPRIRQMEITELMPSLFDWLRSEDFNLDKYKGEIDDEHKEIVRQLYQISADRNPVMAHLFRKFGLPRTVIVGDINYGARKRGVRTNATGSHYKNLNLVMLDSAHVAQDTDEIDPPFTGEIRGNIGTSADAVLRHEFFHSVENRLDQELSGTDWDRIDEITEATDVLDDYYFDHVKPVSDSLEWMSPEQFVRHRKTMMEQNGTTWLSTYGHTNRTEFFAELMSAATSRTKSVREAVPQELRPHITSLLGIDPWKTLEEIDDGAPSAVPARQISRIAEMPPEPERPKRT